MRRLCSVLLLALICFSLIAPAMVAPAGGDLPACCRKAGKHHCAMDAGSGDSAATGVKIGAPRRCPAFPAITISVSPVLSILPHSARTFTAAAVFSHPGLILQTEARARASLARGWQKRGPPSLL